MSTEGTCVLKILDHTVREKKVDTRGKRTDGTVDGWSWAPRLAYSSAVSLLWRS